MKDTVIQVLENQNIEEIVNKLTKSSLLQSTTNKEKSYSKLYQEVKSQLEEVHRSVEKGAMSSSGEGAIIYLNNHGIEHVQVVIEKASRILEIFRDGHLTDCELFILLCAIQVHDIGNVFGRKDHERNILTIVDDELNKIIRDSTVRRCISRIASAHSGEQSGNKDVISLLKDNETILYHDIRSRLLSSILRFADELADDSTRADHFAIDYEILPEGSRIFHEYSKSLKSVRILKDSFKESFFIDLKYNLTLNIVSKKFSKGKEEVFLIDEIYSRAKKMELERKYCLRFLRPYISLETIRGEIIIERDLDLENPECYRFTLEETGYPSNPICIIDSNLDTGEKVLDYLKTKGWLKND